MARIHEHTVNIAAPLSLVNAIPLAMQGDSEADELKLHVLRGREPADMSGYTVGGYLERADGIRVMLKGSVTADVVEVKLQEACYRVPGAYKAFVRLTKTTGEKMTLFLFAGYIESEGDGDIVDDESKIPSIEELVAMIEEIDRATSGANEARDNANAAAEEARTAVEEMRAAIENESSEQVQAIKNAGAGQVSTVQEAGAGQVQVVNAAGAAQMAAIQQKGAQTLATIPADYTETYNRSVHNSNYKADAIMDTSERAASHSLHAQDGPLAVTLYGKTTETGTGDKSPDNPYVISGVDVARVSVSGKNLLPISNRVNSSSCINNNDGSYTFVGEASGTREYLLFGNYGNYVDMPSIGIGARTLSAPGMHPDDRIVVYVASVDGTIKSYGATSGGSVTFEAKSGDRFFFMIFSAGNRSYNNNRAFPMLQAGNISTPYEPYNANVINPPLLPDGSPLMGNGTVDDTIENDVLSGCDKKIVLDGSESWAFWDKLSYLKLPDSVGNAAFCDRFFNASASTYTGAIDINPNTKELRINSGHKSAAEFKAHLAANPLTVYYRSTEYTPEKDLRVCRVVRKCNVAVMDGANVTEASWPTHEGYKAFSYPKFGDWEAKGVYTAAGNLSYWQSDIFANGKEPYNGGIATHGGPNGFSFMLPSGTTLVEAQALVDGKKFAYALKTPETYMSDPLPLRKPTGIMPVTITGSGETAVTYPHETKHYIDDLVTKLVSATMA